MSARESNGVQFQLFPSQGLSLRDYLVGLDPVTSITCSNCDENAHAYVYTASGQMTRWEQLEVDSLMIHVRFPSGVLDTFRIAHIPRGKMIK